MRSQRPRQTRERQTFGTNLKAVLPGVRITQPRRKDGKRPRIYSGICIRDEWKAEPENASGTQWHACQPIARTRKDPSLPMDNKSREHNGPARVPARAKADETLTNGEACDSINDLLYGGEE